LALVLARSKRTCLIAACVGIGALLLAPSVWAVETLGHATSGTFPEGGPANVQTAGGRGTFAGFGGRAGGAGGVQLFGAVAQAGGPPPGSGSAPGTGPGGPSAAGGAGGTRIGMPPGIAGGAGGGPRAGLGAGGLGGAFGGDRSLTQVLSYVKQHGGGTIAVSSQSSAAASIIASNADVAGIGGFSGRESDVSVAWLAQEVSSGSIRWVLGEQTGTQAAGARLPGDTRAGSKAALTAVAKACRNVTVVTSTSTTAAASAASGSSTLYDCQGLAAALQTAGG
jgi:uncharacterized membrane protein